MKLVKYIIILFFLFNLKKKHFKHHSKKIFLSRLKKELLHKKKHKINKRHLNRKLLTIPIHTSKSKQKQ